ncbi:Transposase IS4 [Popillia japonica]|uniref:Transposase IS4 n=1 Tax=Popillia japonica TaxID=7064 RepID=A0AAW1IZS4_POPJA
METFPHEDHWDSSDDELLSEKRKRLQMQKKRKTAIECNWEKTDPVYRLWNSVGALEEYTEHKRLLDGLANSNPVQVFEKFFDDYVIDYIVEQTFLYSTQHNRHEFTVNSAEIRTFIAHFLMKIIGIVVMMSYLARSENGCKCRKSEKPQLNATGRKRILFIAYGIVSVFEKFFDDYVIDYIVEQTFLYSTQHNRHEFTVNSAEIRTFIAILFFSGYHSLPQERMYWSNDEDLDNSNIDTSDKMFKLRPLMNILNNKFKQWGIFHTYLSIDEPMVRYFGRHSAKQFIRGKPTSLQKLGVS